MCVYNSSVGNLITTGNVAVVPGFGAALDPPVNAQEAFDLSGVEVGFPGKGLAHLAVLLPAGPFRHWTLTQGTTEDYLSVSKSDLSETNLKRTSGQSWTGRCHHHDQQGQQ